MFWKRRETRTVTFNMNVRFSTDGLVHIYERPVDEFLKVSQSGKLSGHGALYSPDRTEVLAADFSVDFIKFDNHTISKVVEILEEAGAPLGCTWRFDDKPDEQKKFGTLDGLIARFSDLPHDRHQEFEEFLHNVIDIFHAKHSDTAGFQSVVFSANKAAVSFHGFEYDEMKCGLEEATVAAGDKFGYEIERTTKPAEG